LDTEVIEQEQDDGSFVVAEDTASTNGVNIELVRDLARRAYPDAIPELILGDTVEDVMTSVEAARAAYARVFSDVSERQAVVKAPVVPAGGSSAPLVDVDALPVAEKLRRGVAGRR